MEGQDPPGPAKAHLHPSGQSTLNPPGPGGGFHDPRRRKYMKERSKELNIRASYQGLVDELAARRGVRAGGPLPSRLHCGTEPRPATAESALTLALHFF